METQSINWTEVENFSTEGLMAGLYVVALNSCPARLTYTTFQVLEDGSIVDCAHLHEKLVCKIAKVA